MSKKSRLRASHPATAVAAELECRRLAQERSEEDDDGWETDEIDGDGGASGGDRD
jgi:hypothetical protein